MILSERVKSRVSPPGLAAAAVWALVALSTASLGGAEPDNQTAKPAPSAEKAGRASQPAGEESRAAAQLMLELLPSTSGDLAWPYGDIGLVRVDAPDILTVAGQTDHSIRITAKKEGVATITVWNQHKKVFARIQVTVRGADLEDAPALLYSIASQLSVEPVAGSEPHYEIRQSSFGPALVQIAPIAPQPFQPVPDSQPIEPRKPGSVVVSRDPSAAVQATDGERGPPEFSGARSAQIDVTNLGVAIIDAEGALELAKNELAYVESLYRDKVTNINEVKTVQVKTQTAQRKVVFLTRVAQMACESARQELGFQTKAFQRVSELKAQNVVPTVQVEQALRQLNAAKDKVALLETLPGVKSPAAADTPAKTEEPR